MSPKLLLTSLAAAGLFLAGCETPLPPGAEPGPHGTMAYDVMVEASSPGVQIEADGNHIGEAPVHLKIFGDRDGTFHNFGSDVYVVRAFPSATNQYAQTRIFQTGNLGMPEDRIPQRIYFDMNQPPPAYVPVPVYVSPPPYYYGPGPFYYGPSISYGFGFNFGGGHYHHGPYGHYGYGHYGRYHH